MTTVFIALAITVGVLFVAFLIFLFGYDRGYQAGRKGGLEDAERYRAMGDSDGRRLSQHMYDARR